MSKTGRQAELVGILHLVDVDWHFRVYVMRSDRNEVVARDCLIESLAAKAKALITTYLSDEFVYIRTGFIIAHFGRRGITYSIWHWADWLGTWEYFCQAWYCYGRDLSSMEPLDRGEPIVCHHEINVVAAEANCFIGLASLGLPCAELVNRYRRMHVHSDSQDGFGDGVTSYVYAVHGPSPTKLE